MERNQSVPDKAPELLQAEQAAADALDAYFRSGYGRQAMVSRETKLDAPSLSRMARMWRGRTITLEHAILIEMATGGELRAEMLCPACEPLLTQFLISRAAAVAKAA